MKNGMGNKLSENCSSTECATQTVEAYLTKTTGGQNLRQQRDRRPDQLTSASETEPFGTVKQSTATDRSPFPPKCKCSPPVHHPEGGFPCAAWWLPLIETSSRPEGVEAFRSAPIAPNIRSGEDFCGETAEILTWLTASHCTPPTRFSVRFMYCAYNKQTTMKLATRSRLLLPVDSWRESPGFLIGVHVLLTEETLNTCWDVLKYGPSPCKVRQFLAVESGKVLTTHYMYNYCRKILPSIIIYFRSQQRVASVHVCVCLIFGRVILATYASPGSDRQRGFDASRFDKC
ncbi:hypothetical protein T265_10555 [Opisthorchis viverrini]|uniref:Uncharacterized protein n=1 Tax=Opisthorchis viverrini TaxID=6198 RepID=A0A074ZCW1_OPIVI|nr:hypothetical protein T265_10555 [Opisthorchis viverrini]KER21030.1 hypothetical protein T265_10555 [Opisthorchis viverrini]